MSTKSINDYFEKKTQDLTKIVHNMDDLKNYKVSVFHHDKNSQNIISLKHDNKEIQANYEIVGYYNIISSVWIWANANPFIEKDLYPNLNKILDQKESLIKSKSLESKDRELYYYFVSHNSFFIAKENIDILLKFILYHTQGLWIVSRLGDPNNKHQYEFVILKEILQIK
jgi:hypothetical protein